MATKEEVIDGLLALNFQLRSCEESIANVLNAYDAGIDLEKVTDTEILKHAPITSVEGIEKISERLDVIEHMIKCLTAKNSIAVSTTILQYRQILEDELKKEN